MFNIYIFNTCIVNFNILQSSTISYLKTHIIINCLKKKNKNKLICNKLISQVYNTVYFAICVLMIHDVLPTFFPNPDYTT